MAVFKVETKNKVDIDKKPRVYFTCHPDDFERYFKKVCDDIFKTHDCAIYYTEDMTEVIAEDEKEVDLGRNNLFVVPVTFKLLTIPNRSMDEDIPYALKEHIPVLPIMMEPGIDEFYSKPDKFGELQYLNPYSTDLTEIFYEEKLKKYLESVLISDELAKRVRAAFDAYIFLSYRKKDRKYANELMRLIHSNPECRDIAIWFDEFLTPGESFKENIEKILDDCDLFTLLITPQLLEKVVDENGEERDNYVISTELPLARKKKEEKGTDIFAVEMEDTDKEALSAISIEDYVNSGDSEFRARLLEAISRIAITTNNTPEHNFLIGLAYLEGIDVEVDHERALSLITMAAELDVIDATKKLVNMYSTGVGVKCNWSLALFWQKKIVKYYKQIYINEKSFKTGFAYYDQLDVAVEILYSHSNSITVNANESSSNSINLRNLDDYCFGEIQEILLECKRLSKELCDINCTTRSYMLLIDSNERLSQFYEHVGELSKALEYADINLSLYKKLMDYYKSAKYSFALVFLNLRRGRILNLKGEFEKAKKTLEIIPDFYNTLDKKIKETVSKCYLIEVYIELGDANKNLENILTAESNYLSSIEIIDEHYKYDQEYAIHYCTVMCKLAVLYLQKQDIHKAKSLIDKGLEIITDFEKDYSDIETTDCLAKLYEIYGDLHKQKGDINIARDCYDQAHLIRWKTVDERFNLRVCVPMAILYKKIGEINKDLSMLELALDIFEQACDDCPEIIEYQNEKDNTKKLLRKLRGNN